MTTSRSHNIVTSPPFWAKSWQLIEEEDVGPSVLIGGPDVLKTRTAVSMRRVYAMPIEDVQQLSRGTIALITGGLGAWCQVYPLALPEDLLREAAAFVEATPVAQSPNALIPPPPPQQTRRRAESASQVRRKKKPSPSQLQEARRVETPQSSVPTLTSQSAPPICGTTMKSHEQRSVAEEDDSPVDF